MGFKYKSWRANLIVFGLKFIIVYHEERKYIVDYVSCLWEVSGKFYVFEKLEFIIEREFKGVKNPWEITENAIIFSMLQTAFYRVLRPAF